MFRMKYWNEVEERLRNPAGSMYFAGSTLSVPLSQGRGICLNLDGDGFVLNRNIKNPKVVQPWYITKLVRNLYLEKKGNTEYYKSIVEVE